MEEQWISNPWVAGLNPARGTNFENKNNVCIFALLKNMVYNTAAPSTSAAPFP